MRAFQALKMGATALAVVLAITSCSDGGKKDPINTDSKVAAELIEDLGGYEFTLATLYDMEYLLPERGQSTLGDLWLDRIETVQQQYNCSITVLETNPETMLSDIILDIMAGGKYADFFLLDNFRFLRLIYCSDYFKPLNEIPGFDVNADQFFKFVTDFTTVDGKTYGVAFQNPISGPVSGVAMLYNKALLARHSCEDPYTLFKAGNWTFEKFEQICKAISKDTDGDGINNTWGFATCDWNANNCEKPFLFANDAPLFAKSDSGKITYNLLSDNAQYALNYLNRLMVTDKVFKVTVGYSGLVEMCTEGTIGFYVDNIGILAEFVNEHMSNEDWGMVPVPKGPAAKENVSLVNQVSAWFMANNNSDCEKAAKIFTALSKPLKETQDEYLRAVEEESKYSMFGGKDDVMDVVKYCGEHIVTDISFGIPQPDTLSNAIYDCTRGTSVTPKVAMESISTVFNGIIEDFFVKRSVE